MTGGKAFSEKLTDFLMNFFIVIVVPCCTVRRGWSGLMVSVMTTTLTHQSRMLDWLNVGTDSDHSTVKVNVKMLKC